MLRGRSQEEDKSDTGAGGCKVDRNFGCEARVENTKYAAGDDATFLPHVFRGVSFGTCVSPSLQREERC